ncbi:uncharacterized protein [Vulpes vulpes]|uniref:Uncharacterized protein isoform X1 n=1 Tax=Vulpes vulpes TaxID=9627 RepID=A0ABM5ASU2_VULVU
MFPSAVTALTGAGRSRSPERAGRERARLGERESESARGARGERRRTGGGQALRGLRGVEAGPGVRESPAWGAESGRATPSPGRRRLAAGGGHGGRGAGARGGVRGRRWKPGRLASRGVKGKECTRSAGCGGGLGAGAEPHREAWNSWRVRGGVRARLRSTGSGKEAAQPEKARGALLGARVAPDWLENAARVRARHERSLGRGPDRSNPLPSQRLVRLAVSVSGGAALPRGRGKDSARGACPPSPRARPADPFGSPGPAGGRPLLGGVRIPSPSRSPLDEPHERSRASSMGIPGFSPSRCPLVSWPSAASPRPLPFDENLSESERRTCSSPLNHDRNPGQISFQYLWDVRLPWK